MQLTFLPSPTLPTPFLPLPKLLPAFQAIPHRGQLPRQSATGHASVPRDVWRDIIEGDGQGPAGPERGGRDLERLERGDGPRLDVDGGAGLGMWRGPEGEGGGLGVRVEAGRGRDGAVVARSHRAYLVGVLGFDGGAGFRVANCALSSPGAADEVRSRV